MKKKAIVFNKVSKSFSLNRVGMIKRKFLKKTENYRGEVLALDNISFEIGKNEVVGFYGPNGCGKTTTLKLIAGILKPTRGKIDIRGKVNSVIELGAGLHPELSGIDNIYLYASILGIKKKEINKLLPKIINFSGLNHFIDLPIKKYSSGMRARLAFSVAIFLKPDILLIDEALSIGDQDFRQKSLEAFSKLKKKTAIIITSHNLNLLLSTCDRIISFNQGKIISTGKNAEMNIKKFLMSLVNTKKGYNFKLMSNSMKPTINKGDEVTIKKTEFKKLKEGDIIAFQFKNLDYFIVHRVMGKIKKQKRQELITKGDATISIDPWVITEKNYVGKVVNIKSKKIKTK